ncbi:MAG: hypothetical protein V9E94_18955 [Microthrixaceae bacterium]
MNDISLAELYDDSLSLNDGALRVPGYSMDGWYGRIYRGCGYFDPDKPIKRFTKAELHDLLHKEPTKIKVDGVNLTYMGLIPQIRKSYLSKDVESMQPHVRAFVDRVVTFTTCPDCDGTRLSELARSSKIAGRNIAELCAMQISDLAEWLRGAGGADRRSRCSMRSSHTLDAFVADRARLPVPRPPCWHPVGRRGAAHQDDPPPGLVAHRRHLRVRRADRRTAPPRHRAHERAAAASCATRATPCWWSSTSPRPSRSPTTSSTWARARAAQAARSSTRAPSTACAAPTPPRADTSATGLRSRTLCGPADRVARGAWRQHPQSPATWTWTSPSASSSR